LNEWRFSCGVFLTALALAKTPQVKLFVEVMRGRKKVSDGPGDDKFNPDIALESWDIAILQHPDLLKGGSNATSYLAKMRCVRVPYALNPKP
jgi:hypothetical protein